MASRLERTMRLLNRTSLSLILFSVNVGSLCAAGLFGSIPPLSKVGQLLFWPQNSFPFLRLRAHSLVGSRITFLLLVALVGALLCLLVTIPPMRTWGKSLCRIA